MNAPSPTSANSVAETVSQRFMYSPTAPTYIDRRFNEQREIPEAEVEQLLESVLRSREFKDAAKMISERLGRRLVLYFFNPDSKDAAAATPAVLAISKLRGEHNFDIVGIAVASNADTAKRYVADQGIEKEQA